ncbi:hypothetical protein [Pseudoduganella sp. R-34]|uniref:hypothetical protein n=1 Tax=Pseudoduganella sp. R-34 TaxID=3404062 RepID=UPI003CF3208A
MKYKKYTLTALLPFCFALYGCGGGGHGGDAPQKSPTPQTKPVQHGSSAETQTDPAGEGSSTETQTDKADTVDAGTMTDVPQNPMPPDIAMDGSQGVANGIWIGKAGNGLPAFALVANDTPIANGPANFYFIYSSSAEHKYDVLRGGSMRINKGAIAADVYSRGGAHYNALRGKIDPANTLMGDLYNDAGQVLNNYSFSYSADNAIAPQLTPLYGNYLGVAAKAGDPVPSVVIKKWPDPATATTQAAIEGNMPGCTFRGSIRVGTGKTAVYALEMHAEGPQCSLPDSTGGKTHLYGMAALTTLPGAKAPSLVFAASADQVKEGKYGTSLIPLANLTGTLQKQ